LIADNRHLLGLTSCRWNEFSEGEDHRGGIVVQRLREVVSEVVGHVAVAQPVGVVEDR
jgi:hypothetical protein